ncbi:MAG TPA: hypothetical protein VNY07_06135 [Chthoniobacterales bacterium]|jgi:hypothetical protein|nr:hypothetical protein [Chthoniobacterales bacterium]
MNIRLGTKVLSLILIVTSVWFLTVRVGNASADPFLDGQMKNVESKIGHWERSSYTIACLTYAVTALGAIVALAQSSTKKWVKGGAAVLAGVSALILPINRQFFPADDRAYQKVATQVRNKLDAFGYQLGQFSSLDEETKAALRKKFEGLLADIDQLEYSTIYNGGVASGGSSVSSGLSEILLPSAWADQSADGIRPPAWAEKLPTDERNLYFLGVADGKTFEEAHQNAFLNARNAAAVLFAKTAQASAQLAAKPQLVTQLATALSNAAEIADTFTAPNPAGGYRAFALLRLPKSAAVFTAQSIFVQTGVPYDNTFLNNLRSDLKN